MQPMPTNVKSDETLEHMSQLAVSTKEDVSVLPYLRNLRRKFDMFSDRVFETVCEENQARNRTKSAFDFA